MASEMEVDNDDAFSEDIGDIDWESSFDADSKSSEESAPRITAGDLVDLFVEQQNRYTVSARLTSVTERFSVYTIKSQSEGKERKLELHDHWQVELIDGYFIGNKG